MTVPRTRSTPTEFLEPLRQALQDRYVLGAELGRGAMSVVYRARDLRYDREVAVKVLRSEVSLSLGTERFLQEIAIAARLQHPHILPLLDSGEAAGLLYYVMPCVEGQSLRERLDAEPQLPIAEALRIAREVGTALAYANDHGVIHRDIKPANILLSSGVAIVADFGIARAVVEAGGEKFSTGGLVLGTPGYMSPEQAVGEPRLDGRSDIFSLGCVLYEMLAGEPPFTGPTPQAVTARLVQAPMPPLRVVRGSISPPLERVVERMLAKIPADRFQTAGEFVRALESMHVDSPHYNVPPVRRARWRIVALALAAVALIGFIVWWPAVEQFRERMRGAAATPADTTRIVLLPFEQDGRAGERTIHDHLLHTALSRWRGITLVERYQVADALHRRAPLRSTEDASAVTASLGAGRYIRGALVSVGDSTDASAALFDVGNPNPLARAGERVAAEPAAAAGAYARIARQLLLRGGGSDLVEDSVTAPRSLPAAQAFGRAQLALDEWNLAIADSAFQEAVGFDPTDARANLWLAQVRSWRGLPLTTWSVVAERAAAGSGALSERERALARALVFLARREYGSACRTYDALRVRNDRDFAAWFGLGECHRLDVMAVPDSTSPSKWRFRSSYHQAMKAYAKAFEVLPSVHRGFERGAFSRLRVLLLLSYRYIPAYSVAGNDTTPLMARPSWRGDTLALVPYTLQVVAAGGPAATPPGFAEAVKRQRDQFRRIADGWSAAFPRSSGAKEAVAIALELQGERAAVDTLRVARQLASDPARKARLAATEALLLLKFGTPDDTAYLRRARALTDSLLSSNAPIPPADQQAFGAIAALVGRCELAEQFARQSQSDPVLGIAPRITAEVDALLARVSLGCRLGSPTTSFSALLSAIASERWAGSAAERHQAEELLLLRPALLAPALDPVVLDRLSKSSAHSLLRAARANARGDTATVRTELSAFGMASSPGTPMTPDLAYPGARLWVAIGDTARAIAWLDQTLSDATLYDPSVFTDGAIVASFIRATVLRAELAATKDTAAATRWSAPASILWESADPEIRQTVTRAFSRIPNRR